MQISLDDNKQPQHYLVAILECEHSGTTFGKQSWGSKQTLGWREVHHATAHGIGAGARVYEEFACDTSLQTHVELLVVIKHCPMHCSLFFFSFTFKHRGV